MKRYIKATNLPPRISLLLPLVWWVVLDHFGAPTWLYGVIFTLLAILTINDIARLFMGEAVDLLGNDKN